MSKDLRVGDGETVDVDLVEGDLIAGSDSMIKPKSEDRILVKGSVNFKGGCHVISTLEASRIEGEGRVHIVGNLIVSGSLEMGDGLIIEGQLKAEYVAVKWLKVKESLQCNRVEIGGSLEVEGDLTAEHIGSGGSVSVQGNLKAKSLEVGGSLDLRGSVELEKLSVGRSNAKVGGGTILDIEAGGTFESTGQLRFEKMAVGGSMVRIKGVAKGKSISVGGDLEVDDDLTIDENLEASAVKVKNELKARTIIVRASLGAKVCFSDHVEAGASVETEKGVRSKVFLVGSGSVVGPIVADFVDIGKDVEVEDIYADRLDMDPGSSANSIYAREAKLGSGCRVTGELLYTGRLKLGESVKLQSQPNKVNKLPQPPL